MHISKNNLLVRRVELEISTSVVDTIIKGHYSCDTLNETSDYPRKWLVIVDIKFVIYIFPTFHINFPPLQSIITFIWWGHRARVQSKKKHGGVALHSYVYKYHRACVNFGSRKWNMARRRTVFSVAPYFIVLICLSSVGLCTREGKSSQNISVLSFTI